MTRMNIPVDEHGSAAVQRLPLPADPDPTDRAHLARREALFERVVATAPDAPAVGAARTGRRRVALVTAVATGVLGLTGGALAAAGVFDAPDHTLSGCYLGGGPDEEAHKISDSRQLDSDPIRGCEAEWEAIYAGEAPEMDVYRTEDGEVAVVPRGWQLPDGLAPVTEGSAETDGRPAQVELALYDHIDGLRSECFDADGARDVAQRELDARAMTGWTISVDGDGEGCADVDHVDPSTRTVVLFVAGEGSSPEPFPFVADLDEAVHTGCLDLASAGKAAVEALAAEIEQGGVQIDEVPDDSVECTTADVAIFGGVSVVLRGPGEPSGLAPSAGLEHGDESEPGLPSTEG